MVSPPLKEHAVSEIVVVGSFTAEPGKEDEALAAFEALVEPTHAEPGCILYALHQGGDDPRRLAFVERWASREELDAHLASPHVAAVLERVEELFGDSADIVVYEAVPGGERTKGALADHAAG
jgi:quinol monooxygenase YgiN